MEEIAELCRKAKSSNGEVANKFYQEAYAKLELLHVDNTSVTQEDLLNNWGMALASHYGQTQDDTEADKLFAQANKKFELALEASSENKHLVLTHWGDLYLQKVYFFFVFFSEGPTFHRGGMKRRLVRKRRPVNHTQKLGLNMIKHWD